MMRVRAFGPEDAEAIASLMAFSFESKWARSPKLPRDRLPRLLLECGFVPTRPFDGFLVAEDDSGVIGFIILKWAGQRRPRSGWDGPRTTPLLQRLRLIVRGLLLEEGARKGEVYLESIAVADSVRGMGVGTALIERAIDVAIQLGMPMVSLYVSSDNIGAMGLYGCMGFSEVSRTRSMLTAWLLGQGEWVRMVKDVR